MKKLFVIIGLVVLVSSLLWFTLYRQSLSLPGPILKEEFASKYELKNTNQAYSPSVATSANDTAFTFQGHVSKGGSLRKDIGRGLIFELTPDDYGWDIDIVSSAAQQYDYGFASIATPPFHGINDLQIEGWHFRNASNTAENDGSINAPQKERSFSFVTNKQDAKTMADAVGLYTSGKTLDFNPNVSSFGKGELVIQNLKLGNLVPGSQSWIESIDFTVKITFPEMR